MRSIMAWIGASFLAATLAGGCPPRAEPDSSGDLLALVAGVTETEAAALATPVAGPELIGSATISGTVRAGEYQLFDVGRGSGGDEWVVTSLDDNGAAFLVVLFDSNLDLLRRDLVVGENLLRHVLRGESPVLRVGVAPFAGGPGGDFRFEIQRWPGRNIPAPAPQVVWLNFGGAGGVRVHGRPPIALAPFEAAALGAACAGQDALIKAVIVETIRDDYAPYNVTVISSDEGAPPSGPYATVHVGGRDERLLGLADSVDQYNADPWQTAVVYAESFVDYEGMGLSAAEMGQMVGNVASHEFGHLLGLFHTRVPTDLMDTTGSAWDLAGQQQLSRATLERSVFPVGHENSPARLAETVGWRAEIADASLAEPAVAGTMPRKGAIRALAREALRGRCGTCLSLDD